jgi:glycosyltransferase involved in cell wall biosynthesis
VNGRICWQRFGPAVSGADLVVVTQELKLLYNLVPMFCSRPYRLAFWGHGRNFQAKKPLTLVEAAKRLLVTRVDWWFAYTELTERVVQEAGFPRDRITCLNNCIDTDAFRQQLQGVSPQTLGQLRESLGIRWDSRVALYCGSLYPEKRIPLLLDAALEIRKRLGDFHLVVIGAGSEAAQVQAASQRHPWIHRVGVQHGESKAAYFAVADVLLNPGAMGLTVLDAFCAGLPVVTTGSALHGPEIAYLEPGRNGVVAPDTPREFADAVVDVLSSEQVLFKLAGSARDSATRFSLSAMVDRFSAGIMSCLSIPKP